MKPLPILYLDHAPIWGGAEIVLLNLVCQLNQKHFIPIIGTPKNSHLAIAAENNHLITSPIEFPTLNHSKYRLPQHLTTTVSQIRQAIHKYKIDLIHTNTVRAHIVGSIAGWLTRTPVIWTLHDNTFPPRLVSWLAPIPRQVITVSTWLADTYEPYGLSGKCNVIPNGLPQIADNDQSPSICEELGIPLDAPIVLNVGRLIAGKAPHLFIAAAEITATRHPEAHFILVGGLDDDEAADHAYLKQLTQAITDTPLGTRLHAVGPRQDVGRFYRAADIIVYNAVQPEGLPTVLLEAMAYAKPVIASALGGALEIVGDGVTGLLTPPHNATALAEALDTLLSNPADQEAMGLAGRKRLTESFSIAQQVQKTTKIYHTVLPGVQP